MAEGVISEGLMLLGRVILLACPIDTHIVVGWVPRTRVVAQHEVGVDGLNALVGLLKMNIKI